MKAIRSVSAIGAGVLLASTPHCGGKSMDEHDSNDGGTSHAKGGASGSAGYGGSTGAYGGQGTGAYGGDWGGWGGTGTSGYGGSVGIGGSYPETGGYSGTGVVGIPNCVPTSVCWAPLELRGCWPDAGVTVDAGPDTGIGGEGGAASEADEPPMRIGAAPNIDAGTDAGSGAAEPPIFDCPVFPPFPQCVMPGPGSSGVPSHVSFSFIGWNGTQCCYNFDPCR
jgi:hypothetical protein